MAHYESLRVCLKDWVDFDVAEFHLARCLGIMEEDVPGVSAAKAVFWSNNPVGSLLGRFLEEMKQEGMIEIDEEESKMRWNPQFSWEEKAFGKK